MWKVLRPRPHASVEKTLKGHPFLGWSQALLQLCQSPVFPSAQYCFPYFLQVMFKRALPNKLLTHKSEFQFPGNWPTIASISPWSASAGHQPRPYHIYLMPKPQHLWLKCNGLAARRKMASFGIQEFWGPQSRENHTQAKLYPKFLKGQIIFIILNS